MPRSIDWKCQCGHVEGALAEVDETRTCPQCGHDMEQDWLPRVRRDAQWDDNTAVLVHVDPKTGDIRYPGRHDAKLKDGYERHYLRSLSDVNKFEREHGVTNHVMHFDNNGRAIDDHIFKEKATH